jgi:hypothetical protein
MQTTTKGKTPTEMTPFDSIAVFENTTGINRIISTVNSMLSYFKSEISSVKSKMATKAYIDSQMPTLIDPLSEQLNTLSAKVDTLMGNGGNVENAEPSEGGRRSKRRTMKKRK